MTDIAKILKDYPDGTKLWSPYFGNVELVSVNLDNVYFPITIETCFHEETLTREGIYNPEYDGADCILFPSAKMRDWEKFRWKKGDILSCICNETKAVFDDWADDAYETFNTSFTLNTATGVYQERKECSTSDFFLAWYKVSEDVRSLLKSHYGDRFKLPEAKAEERTAETSACNFKPFDKVLVRKNNHSVWEPAFYNECITAGRFRALTLKGESDLFGECVHYSDKTKTLVGSTNKYEGI